MLKALQRRFVLIAMLSLTLTLFILVSAVNVAYYIRNTTTSDWLLQTLVENNGVIPDRKLIDTKTQLTEESPFETRYFIITMSQDGAVTSADLSHIAAFDRDGASTYVTRILEQGKTSGYFDRYRYLVQAEVDGGHTVYVLDCHQQQLALYSIIRITFGISVFCLITVLLLLSLFSKQAIKPFSDNLAKQKQFITDASHELKTPLAIIAANAEVLSLDGDNQWITSIRSQSGRLNELIESLIELSRNEETAQHEIFKQVDMGIVCQGALTPFYPMVSAQHKKLTTQIQPHTVMRGSEDALRRLLSILMENAIKYTPENGSIRLTVTHNAKNTHIRISNTCKAIAPDKLAHLFDRFYRADDSRSRQTGGFGIGLSVAQAIVQQHKGKISVSQANDEICFTIQFASA